MALLQSENNDRESLYPIACDSKLNSDNGPCFKALEFRDFHTKLWVVTKTSSACNHTSLDSVERMVQTVKQIMTKNPENVWLGLFLRLHGSQTSTKAQMNYWIHVNTQQIYQWAQKSCMTRILTVPK